MTNLEQLTQYIKKLSADAVNTLLDAVKVLLASENTADIPDCPYCSGTRAIRYGHKCGKQRFPCKQCGRTFVTTTNTVMSHSHFDKAVWQEVISDTVQGNAIRYTTKRLMQKNWQGFIQAISPRTLWYCAMDSKATRALLLLQAVP